MSRAGTTAAIILAAGRSARMGRDKPLLPLGPSTVIERVVRMVAHAGVDDIVVVTGHEPERLAAVLHHLPVRQVHNAGYDAGMFSSVRTGVAALGPDVEAFFVLPADCPLVRADVLERLLDAFRAHRPDARQTHPPILHPTCCGRRGHPPLVPGSYREALLRAGDDHDLRGFLRSQRGCEAEVEVEDLTVLVDMDTEEDYQRICRLAAVLDGRAADHGADGRSRTDRRRAGPREPASDEAPIDPLAAPAARESSLSADDALYLLSLLEVPDRVRRHCLAVAQVGEAMARALRPRVPALDADLVRTACQLHDMARAAITPLKHAAAGRNILTNLGLPRLGELVGMHMALPTEEVDMPAITEAQIVYLADKLVSEDRVVALEERTQRTLHSLSVGDKGVPSGAFEGLHKRMHAAGQVLAKVEDLTGRPLEDALREVLPREMFQTSSSI